MTAQLELKTHVVRGSGFYLFDEVGIEIALASEEGWKWSDSEHENRPEFLDRTLSVDLKPGKYWLIESNLNVTDVRLVTADASSVRIEEIVSVTNGASDQTDEIGAVVSRAPSPVFERFLRLAELETGGKSAR